MNHISIPLEWVGPVAIHGMIEEEVLVPLATYETTLWPSTNRGAHATRSAGGIYCQLISDCMTRSVVVQGDCAHTLICVVQSLYARDAEIKSVLESTSTHLTIQGWNHQIIGNLLYLRLQADTEEASGHNMITQAADAWMTWLLAEYPLLRYVSISGNYCTDKKNSSVNGILGRGKYVTAETWIPRSVCVEILKTTPESLVNVHIKKNLLGSCLAGGVRTANAHFANILLAVYLATGQDAANIIEGSQGFVHTECVHEDRLYFSITVPNLIVGTVGHGKKTGHAFEILQQLGCVAPHGSKRLAIVIAATVLCGELSLLAAQTEQKTLMNAHRQFERGMAQYRSPRTTCLL